MFFAHSGNVVCHPRGQLSAFFKYDGNRKDIHVSDLNPISLNTLLKVKSLTRTNRCAGGEQMEFYL
jgi:hypothetical protein